jgi:hypothetical protein
VGDEATLVCILPDLTARTRVRKGMMMLVMMMTRRTMMFDDNDDHDYEHDDNDA